MGLEPPRIPSPITLCLGEENGARFFAQVALLCLLKVVGTPGHSPQGQVYPYLLFPEPTNRAREPCVAGPPSDIPFGYLCIPPTAVTPSLGGSGMSEEVTVLPEAYHRTPWGMTHFQ